MKRDLTAFQKAKLLQKTLSLRELRLIKMALDPLFRGDDGSFFEYDTVSEGGERERVIPSVCGSAALRSLRPRSGREKSLCLSQSPAGYAFNNKHNFESLQR